MVRWLRLVLVLAVGLASTGFQATPPVVRAVLFFSPTCPHCEMVMTETLPPIMAHYGDQLEILAVDVTKQGGQSLYQAAVETLGIPDARRGVPTLVVGSTFLVGSFEIPDQFPGLIDAGLADGGVDWPAIPDLLAGLPAESTPQQEPAAGGQAELGRIFTLDPIGGMLAGLVLLAGLGTLAWAATRLVRGLGGDAARHGTAEGGQQWIRSRWLPALAFAGALISLYLAYVETSGSQAFCGPIGNCNAVQQSAYARLFGVLPVGVLGVLGYGAILWLNFYRSDHAGRPADRASLGMLALTSAGAAFSAYLTFLEVFVIVAVCTWCLASAVLMTLLLGLSVRDGVEAIARIRPQSAST